MSINFNSEQFQIDLDQRQIDLDQFQVDSDQFQVNLTPFCSIVGERCQRASKDALKDVDQL